jgi:hypothetical protein
MARERRRPAERAGWQIVADGDVRPGNIFPVLAELLLASLEKRQAGDQAAGDGDAEGDRRTS